VYPTLGGSHSSTFFLVGVEMTAVKNATEPGATVALARPGADGLTLIAQLGKSLDGQIATAAGHSKYINGQAGLAHLHRLRAWADVVVIGVGTLIADNPRLNVRLASGPDPDRVVIDPRGRSPEQATCLNDPSVRRVVLVGPQATSRSWPAGIESVQLPINPSTDQIDTAAIRRWLGRQGWRRVLVEGGAATMSHFLAQGTLDALHLITSPLLIGPGVAGIRAHPLRQLSQKTSFEATSHWLGDDLLIACQLGS
jgi:riboflavin-specific deaminase-like protein